MCVSASAPVPASTAISAASRATGCIRRRAWSAQRSPSSTAQIASQMKRSAPRAGDEVGAGDAVGAEGKGLAAVADAHCDGRDAVLDREELDVEAPDLAPLAGTDDRARDRRVRRPFRVGGRE